MPLARLMSCTICDCMITMRRDRQPTRWCEYDDIGRAAGRWHDMQHATQGDATCSMQLACNMPAGRNRQGSRQWACVQHFNRCNRDDCIKSSTPPTIQRNGTGRARRYGACGCVVPLYTLARRWVDRSVLLTRSIYSADELKEWPEE